MASRTYTSNWATFRRHSINALVWDSYQDADRKVPLDLTGSTYEIVFLPSQDSDIGDALLTLDETDVVISGADNNRQTLTVSRANSEIIPEGCQWYFINRNGFRVLEGTLEASP